MSNSFSLYLILFCKLATSVRRFLFSFCSNVISSLIKSWIFSFFYSISDNYNFIFYTFRFIKFFLIRELLDTIYLLLQYKCFLVLWVLLIFLGYRLVVFECLYKLLFQTLFVFLIRFLHIHCNVLLLRLFIFPKNKLYHIPITNLLSVDIIKFLIL